MNENRLYKELAYLWPLISPPEEYAKEAGYWRNALRAKLGPGRHPILELGVGGGHNLSHLTWEFQATAVDISKEMLSLSMKLNPGVEHIVGDMRSVRLGRTFKAVIVHDAIDYMLTEADLRAAFQTARAHLKEGGVFITAPDCYPENFPGTQVWHRTFRRDGLEVTFIEYETDPDPMDTTTESMFLYLIKEQGRLRVEQDRHVSGLFPLETWLRLLGDAGFKTEQWPYPVHDDGREAHLLVSTLQG
ncbi:MAG: class I SAM-dependent methyltransferase [Dehalococcoidia bacterium]|nr:class I SAM-dependent methyltransferase [Dehalococcoidia bacterium]